MAKYAYICPAGSGLVVIDVSSMAVVGSLLGGSGVSPYLYLAYGIALTPEAGVKGSPLIDERIFKHLEVN
jgi:hypothetical protein